MTDASGERSSRRQPTRSRTGRPPKPTGQVGQRGATGLVGEMEVVDPEQAGRRSRGQGRQRGCQGIEEADAGTRTVVLGWRRGPRGRRQVQQPAQLQPDGLVERGESFGSAGQADAGTQQPGDRTVGDRALTRVAAAGHDPATADADDRRERFAESGLADPGLALDEREAAVGLRAAPGANEPVELGRAPDERQRDRHRHGLKR